MENNELDGRPGGLSSAAPMEPSVPLSPPKASIPDAWRFDVLPFEHRPMRQFVAVVGWRDHSGHMWHRLGLGVAWIDKDGRQGYKEDDLRQIERDSDMEPGSGLVHGWMPFILPAFPIERQGEDAVLASAIEAGTAATPQSDAVHESAGPQDDARKDPS